MKQTKTITFDWELYNNNRDKYKVITRDGDEVTQLTKFVRYKDHSVLVGVRNNTLLTTWHANGNWSGLGITDIDLQLQYEEEVVESWMNLHYNNDGRIITSGTYPSKELAEMVICAAPNFIKTINLNDLV